MNQPSDPLSSITGQSLFRAIPVTGSRAEIAPFESLVHIAVISKIRALRWHPGGLESWSLSDWGVALAGEVGEVCDVIKKMNRARDHLKQSAVDPTALRQQLAMEIGDSFLYLDLLAQAAGLELADCIRDTFNRVSEREGFPERL